MCYRVSKPLVVPLVKYVPAHAQVSVVDVAKVLVLWWLLRCHASLEC